MFIARQPIFNKAMKIHGYELLFRADTSAESFGNSSSLSATAVVLGGLFEQGIDKVVGNAKAFVNFDYEFIMSDIIELIDPKTLVIEVLETVQVDDPLIHRLQELKAKGYKIALDDFEEHFDTYPIVPLANIIKYDIMITPLDTIEEDVKLALAHHKVVLAEKIETQEEFLLAKSMGFQLFQGYFFSKPQIIREPTGKQSSKVQYARILREVKKEEPSYDEIVAIITSDVNLAYRVVKLTGSKSTTDDNNSIKKALVKMGFKEIERWVNILLLQDMAQNKPSEIMRLSLIRSRFSEYLASNSIMNQWKDEASMMCLFSLLDAILDQKMESALEGMHLSEEIYQALVSGSGPLKPICRLIGAYEQGDWKEVRLASEAIRLDPGKIAQGYINAISWSNLVMSRS